MSKFIIPKIAETRKLRSNKIDGYLQKAEELNKKTEVSIKKYEAALNEATQKANQEIAQTRETLNALIADKQAKLEKKLHDQIKAGEEEIELQKKETLKEIKGVAASITTEILHKLNIKDISLTEIKSIINREAQ